MVYRGPDQLPADRIVDFDVNMPPNLERGFHESWHNLISSTPHRILWTRENGGHWIVTDGALLHEFFRQPDRLSNKVLFVPRKTAELHQLIPTTLDPPEHTPYRNLLNKALSPGTVRRVSGQVRQVSAELIDSFAGRGECDFIAEYSSLFPIRIFMSLVDLPEEDVDRLKYWCDALVRPNPDLSFNDATALLVEYMLPIVRSRQGGAGGEDLLSELMTGEVDGQRITEESALKLAIQILIAGLDTVVNILGFIWLYLARTPEVQKQIAEAGDRIGFVEELVRRFPVVSIARLAQEDIQVDDVIIRADDVVAMPTMAHGLDPKANVCPMQVDFERAKKSHSTFGAGPHRCPGAHLARTEILATLDAWFDRIPAFRYDGDGLPKMHGGIVGTMENLPLRWD
ncbi:cytochrome P450 [Emcibacter sp.]|uniref:cytochrome P450 n=1 Tax=Emcibacter sp. TaxID=1979954 RepID=UPI002AA6E918|nr:cytochrome P450 [Emcibacter sp.]